MAIFNGRLQLLLRRASIQRQSFITQRSRLLGSRHLAVDGFCRHVASREASMRTERAVRLTGNSGVDSHGPSSTPSSFLQKDDRRMYNVYCIILCDPSGIVLKKCEAIVTLLLIILWRGSTTPCVRMACAREAQAEIIRRDEQTYIHCDLTFVIRATML